MNRIGLHRTIFALTTLIAAHAAFPAHAADRPLNVLLFTADDLNADSVGAYGCTVPDITPNLDRFATESMRFERAHVTVAICQPSRGVLATGRFPHHSGVMGFMHTDRDVPTIMQTLRDAGYRTGVLGKVGHSTPHVNYKWDCVKDQPDLGAGRSPTRYYEASHEFLSRCRDEGKAFYFMVNSHDPHRPYHIPGRPNAKLKGAEEPSRIYSPGEITIPGFLPDLPGVREEVSYYFNSVRRLDDTFGRVMAALEETGFKDNTVVMFLSDNGIAMPFAKCNAYLASTRTPWMVRWPGVVKPGVNRDDFISGIDFFPTALDAAGLRIPEGLDGRTFAPLLKGMRQTGRDHVFTQIDCKAGGDAVPMRAYQTAKFGYIFNSFADAEHVYRNNNEGQTFKAMSASGDPLIAARVRLFRYRPVEEFFDLTIDPNCLVNLAEDPRFQRQIEEYRRKVAVEMRETNDPLISAFDLRRNPKKMEDVMWETYAPWRGKKRGRNNN